MSDYILALWALNLGFAPASVKEFANHIEHRLRESQKAGASLLVLPEYAIEASLAFKPVGLQPDREIAFMAGAGMELLEELRPLPKKYGVSLLAGTMPWAVEDGFENTAVLLTADGREIRQPKLCLTPGEKDPDSWQLQGGSNLQIFDLDGLTAVILVCLDVEMPALSCLLAREQVDLILVPSMTEKLSGYHRVFGCAKARAVELMASVAVCGTVGATPGTTQMETNVSGAALYLPCEEELGYSGVAIDHPPTDGTGGEEPFVIAAVPVNTIHALRDGGAEVWPGAWTPQHVEIKRRAREVSLGKFR